MSLPSRMCEARLIVCVGPGGVGKTTLAAALGVSLARQGRRVFVLTIDPARRLAEALGMDQLGDRAATVPLGVNGRMQAAMLDTRSSYDALLRRLAPSDDAFQAVLDNAAYRAFSRTLARSHAYVAMERMLEEVESGEHDVVILDTPPLRSALDILDAPGRLAAFLDSGAARALVGAGGVTAAVARRLLAVLTGRRLAVELAGFLSLLLPLEAGFRARAERAHARLQANDTAFVLVAAPRSTTLFDAEYLASGLAERGVPLAACFLNRSFIGEASAPLTPLALRPGSPLAQVRARVVEMQRKRDEIATKFLASLPALLDVRVLPELAGDVRTVPALVQLATLLEAARGPNSLTIPAPLA